MPARTSDEKGVYPSVRLSVCLSVKRVNCDKTEEKSVQIFIPYEKSFSLVFWEKNGWWELGATTSTWNFGSAGPSWSEIADFEPIFARRASAVTSSEKSSIRTNREFTSRFPMSLRWSSYVAFKPPSPSKGGSKMQNDRFRCEIAFRLKKVCYKVSMCKNCQRESCKTFIGLTIRTNMVGTCVKIWRILTHPLSKRRFSIYFRP